MGIVTRLAKYIQPQRSVIRDAGSSLTQRDAAARSIITRKYQGDYALAGGDYLIARTVLLGAFSKEEKQALVKGICQGEQDQVIRPSYFFRKLAKEPGLVLGAIERAWRGLAIQNVEDTLPRTIRRGDCELPFKRLECWEGTVSIYRAIYEIDYKVSPFATHLTESRLLDSFGSIRYKYEICGHEFILLTNKE